MKLTTTALFFYSDIDIEEYNAFIKSFEIQLDDSILIKYLESMLLLLDYDSKIIFDKNQIMHLALYMEADPEFIDEITPLKYIFEGGKIFVEFCSWNRKGYIRKWRVAFLYDGQIIDLYEKTIVGILLYI